MKESLVLSVVILLLNAFPAYDTTAAKVIDEINLARTNPQKYVEYLQEWKSHYVGRSVKLPDSRCLRTKEGVPAVDEAIEYMKKRAPIEPLVHSRGMDRAAGLMVKLQGATTQIGHHTPDGRGVSDRVDAYGQWLHVVGENISYGLDDPRQIVMLWIIGDGVPNRAHRTNMFRRDFRVAGAAMGPHLAWQVMCVVDFAGGFESF